MSFALKSQTKQMSNGYYHISARSQSFFCLQLHADEANGQYKGNDLVYVSQ